MIIRQGNMATFMRSIGVLVVVFSLFSSVYAGYPLLQGAPVPVSLDPLWIIGAIIAFGGTVWGLLAKGVIRMGSQVDQQIKDIRESAADVLAVKEAQLTDAKTYALAVEQLARDSIKASEGLRNELQVALRMAADGRAPGVVADSNTINLDRSGNRERGER